MPQDISQNSKRIAKNTLYLYVRMLLLLFVSLFTARVMLEALGVENYGLNNVIAGVIVLFSFLNNTLATATSRFLTYELGTGDLDKLKKTFSNAWLTHGLLAILVLVLGESLGIYLVNSVLNIPESRVFACNVVYQLTLFQVLLTLTQTPFSAIVMSYEKMDFYAYLGVFDAVAKLLICFLVKESSFDKLISLSILQTAVTIIVYLIYIGYCKRNFKNVCSLSICWNKTIFRSMLKFTGWSLIGSVSVVLKNQGVNILMNIFFGPVVNAANAIAYRVNSALLGFSSNLTVAINPQITKNYASGQYDAMKTLIYKGGKASFFILMLLGFPIIFEADYVLHLWLGEEVPQYAATMTILVIVLSMIEAFTYSIGNAIQATGNIRNYQIVISGITLLNCPVVFFLFKLNFPPYTALAASICISSVALCLRLYFIKVLLQMDPWEYIKAVFLKTIPVAFLCLIPPLFYTNYLEEGVSRLLMNSVLITAWNILIIWFFGLDQKEKEFLKNLIKKYRNRLCK